MSEMEIPQRQQISALFLISFKVKQYECITFALHGYSELT